MGPSVHNVFLRQSHCVSRDASAFRLAWTSSQFSSRYNQGSPAVPVPSELLPKGYVRPCCLPETSCGLVTNVRPRMLSQADLLREPSAISAPARSRRPASECQTVCTRLKPAAGSTPSASSGGSRVPCGPSLQDRHCASLDVYFGVP